MERQARNAAIEYITKVTDQLRAAGLNAGSVVLKGSPAEAILDYAGSNDVDLVILSTHGRSGPSRWALGSVADHVLRRSVVPVMIISPKGCRIG
jgi:nucleotide-binding universal stress UspA family protein